MTRNNLICGLVITGLVLMSACSSSEEQMSNSSSPATPNNSRPAPSPSLNTNSGESSSPPIAMLHIDNVKNVPVALELTDFYKLEDAIRANRDSEALQLIKKGRVLMIPNDSAIIVLENTFDKARVEIQSNGRVGWVKNDWVQPMKGRR